MISASRASFYLTLVLNNNNNNLWPALDLHQVLGYLPDAATAALSDSGSSSGSGSGSESEGEGEEGDGASGNPPLGSMSAQEL